MKNSISGCRRNRPDGVRIRSKPRLGLEQRLRQRPECRKSTFRTSCQSTGSFGMLIGMLVITRIKQLGIKGLLTSKEEWFSFQLPFDLSKSPSATPDHYLRQHLRPRRERFLPNPLRSGLDSICLHRLDLHPAVQNQIQRCVVFLCCNLQPNQKNLCLP